MPGRIGSVAQQDQRCELIQEAGRLNGRRDQDEEGYQQGDPSVHHLEQLIEDHRQGDIGHGDHDMGREPGPIQQLVGLDVLGRGGEVPSTTSMAGTMVMAKAPPRMLIRYRAPAILAS